MTLRRTHIEMGVGDNDIKDLYGYRMVDASKKSYGATLHIGSNLNFRFEQWTSTEKEEL